MKANLNSTSKRALSILANPNFKKQGLDAEFVVSLDKSDKILTVFHDGKSGEVELIFNDVLAIFAKNRSVSELWKINFREVENFLRDENHLPAFGETTSELEDILNFQKISLISGAIKARSGEELNILFEVLFDWEKLSLVAKNEWAKRFVTLLGSELIFCDETAMTFTKAPKDVDDLDFELLVKEIFNRGEFVLPMKVVAV